MKPENFLCPFSDGNFIDPSRGFFMEHLGIRSRWEDTNTSAGHIAYGQKVDLLSNNIRYA